MHIVRYIDQAGSSNVGSLSEDGQLKRLPVASMNELLAMPLQRIRWLTTEQSHPLEDSFGALGVPVDGFTEVWASGVTYKRSKEARVEESTHQDVYERVYEADRPELFYKCAAWRVVTDREPVGVRSDSRLNVPEPELAVVANAYGEIVGLMVCNDMSSRSLEGENPLYLPQAKCYAGSCSLSNGIRPIWEVTGEPLTIDMRISRGDDTVFSGQTSTGEMKRSLTELVRHLFEAENFPGGVVLSTGTGLVPDLDFILQTNDIVQIDIHGVGSLENRVVKGKEEFLPYLRRGHELLMEQ